MAVRFRIRTSAGQELSFASQEMFEDFVRSGDLSPDDLVYDGATGSWSPARTHPTVLEVQYEEEGGEEPTPEASAPRGDEPISVEAEEAGETADRGDEAEEEAPGEADLDDDLGLDLALHEEESAEEAKRRLIEKLEAERRSELDPGGGVRETFTDFMVDSGSAELKRTERPGERPPPSPTPPQSPTPSAPPEKPTRRRQPAPRPTSPALAGKSAASRGAAAAAEVEGGKGGAGRLLLVLGVLAVVAGGAYLGYQALQAGPVPSPEPSEPSEPAVEAEPTPDPDPPVVPVVEEAEAAPPSSEPVIADTEAAVRARAQERYLASTQTAFRDLEPIPDVWATGPYLAVPSDYPGVVDVWQHYRSTVGEIRASDQERYREALEAALDDAGLEGEGRDARLNAVLASFDASAALRAAHYDRVESLATAALRSHNALVEAEGLLIYDPTGSTGPEEGIGRGMSGRDADSQLLLDQVVELLTASLEADGQGPGSPENVREWVWDGFLDAATR